MSSTESSSRSGEPRRIRHRPLERLNATQLSRKRARDREAQRVLRQKNKEHIDTLERKVAQLRIQGDLVEELRVYRQENKRLYEELMQLKAASSAPMSQSSIVQRLEDRVNNEMARDFGDAIDNLGRFEEIEAAPEAFPNMEGYQRSSRVQPATIVGMNHIPSKEQYYGNSRLQPTITEEVNPISSREQYHGNSRVQPTMAQEVDPIPSRGQYYGNSRVEPLPVEGFSHIPRAFPSNEQHYGNSRVQPVPYDDEISHVPRAFPSRGQHYGSARDQAPPIEKFSSGSGSHPSWEQYQGHPRDSHLPFVEAIAAIPSNEVYSGNMNQPQALNEEEDIEYSNPSTRSGKRRRYRQRSDFGQSVVVANTRNQYQSFPTNWSRNPQYAASYVRQPSPNFWDLPIKITTPQGIVEDLLVSVIRDRRKDSGVLAPCREAAMSNAFYLELPPGVVTDSISSAAAKVLEALSILRIPERAASIYFMHRLCCYLIEPTAENLNRLPDWYVPLPSQMSGEHPIWASFVIFPGLRDVIIKRPELYSNEEFLTAWGLSINLNWPYGDDKCFLLRNNEILLNPVYERHLRRLDSWSIDLIFARRYPELQGACTFSGVFRPYTPPV
jgi:hypothetical protein